MLKRLSLLVPILAICFLFAPLSAWAVDDGYGQDQGQGPSRAATVSTDEAAVVLEDCTFALNGYARANAGSNKAVDGNYYGYSYFIGTKSTDLMYTATTDTVVVYVDPDASDRLGIRIDSAATQEDLKALITAIDKATEHGTRGIPDTASWYFTQEEGIEVDGVVFSFDRRLPDGRSYNCVIGKDGSDVTISGSAFHVELTHSSFAELVETDSAQIVGEATFKEKAAHFFGTLDWSPLTVTLKTSFTAILFIFVLGLAAAYLTLRVSPRTRDILDTIFTIPMVLPPTVCGFLLLLALGNNTALGQWFNSIGFPLVFSWPATVIAAVVVAFPLMYRNARGAFENLDPNMMDAARTLGWRAPRIFFKIMLPLSWSSIAAATVLAFARALGEYGATLFLAGNYAGITRTIPISIYFYWKIGRTDLAIFWTLVIIVFSFIVILFINLWSRHTTRYRVKEVG